MAGVVPVARLASILIFAAVSAGCQSWTVIEQAKPNPLSHATGFVVAPFDFVGMQVTQQQRELLERAFGFALRLEAQGDFKFKTPDQASPSDVIIRTQVALVEGETVSEVQHGDAEVVVTVSLMQGDALVDKIQKVTELGMSGGMSQGQSRALGWLSDQQQLSSRGEELGDEVADYLQKRAR